MPASVRTAKELTGDAVSMARNVMIVVSMSKQWKLITLLATYDVMMVSLVELGSPTMVKGRMDMMMVATSVDLPHTWHEYADAMVNAMLAMQGPVQLPNVSVARSMPKGRPVV